MRWYWLLAVPALAAAGIGVVVSCQPAFPTEASAEALTLTVTGEPDGGAPNSDDNRYPIVFVTPQVFTVHIEAHKNGVIDPNFKGYVRLSIEPGNVIAVNGVNTNGRNVELIGGTVAQDVAVSVLGAYGNARIVATDLGYQPVDPAGVTLPDGGTRPPQCANSIDDNENGLVDYPVDPGCYAANDDSEDGGSYATASSGIIYFKYPQITDVEGATNAGGGTPFPSEAVQIDTGWSGSTAGTQNGVVVTGISSTGFFVTDIGVPRPYPYASLYGYTYSAPQLMNVCDRLITLGGTAAEFYGFLELNYPTWSLEEWDPLARPCLVPEPVGITLATLQSMSEVALLTPLEAGLVRVPAADGSTVHIANLIGPGLMPYTMVNGLPVITLPIDKDSTNCDYEGTGKIDFDNAVEAACEDACQANAECSEYSSYVGNSQFQLVVVDAEGSGATAITGDGSAAASFDPVAQRGQALAAFSGNLTFFSGGSQFTIQARCADDIVAAGKVPLPSSPPWPVPDGGTQAPAACVLNSAVSQVSN